MTYKAWLQSPVPIWKVWALYFSIRLKHLLEFFRVLLEKVGTEPALKKFLLTESAGVLLVRAYVVLLARFITDTH